MSRQHAVNIVGIDFPASDGERQVPEADGIKPGAQTAVEYEHAAAPVRLGVEQFAVDGQAVQHSVIIQAADHDGVAGGGSRGGGGGGFWASPGARAPSAYARKPPPPPAHTVKPRRTRGAMSRCTASRCDEASVLSPTTMSAPEIHPRAITSATVSGYLRWRTRAACSTISSAAAGTPGSRYLAPMYTYGRATSPEPSQTSRGRTAPKRLSGNNQFNGG